MADPRQLRTVIVDDEPLARERLRTLLADQPDIDIVAECEDGRAAVEAIEREEPDIVFLDVQMPELTGFEVVESLRGPLPRIIFVTAYDHYAIRAFDVHALDYLLKPFDRQRFERSLRRARDDARNDARLARTHEQLRALLTDAVNGEAARRRVVVRGRGRIHFVPLDDIEYMEAAGNYIRIHAEDGEHLLRETMTRMDEKLPSGEFVRVSRSSIVRVDRIQQLTPRGNGKYLVGLRSGAVVRSGRSYAHNLTRLLSD